MLSQRMAKCYLAMGQSVQPRDADRLLGTSMALFDRQLVELKAFAPTPEIKATYAQLEASWSDYKGALVGSAPSKAGAPGVIAKETRDLRALTIRPIATATNLRAPRAR